MKISRNITCQSYTEEEFEIKESGDIYHFVLKQRFSRESYCIDKSSARYMSQNGLQLHIKFNKDLGTFYRTKRPILSQEYLCRIIAAILAKDNCASFCFGTEA
ncbi:hypothetical protein Anas_12353 [Armadillidium nasatum]|uniref:Uncharacterized protein n=1 Tax=Armadillidium nasatum TaxID=96803 RepID=A0A5N5T617_9CRUS|nr:hypothetical protein Anas_12353 [Armadillidium nasatum]